MWIWDIIYLWYKYLYRPHKDTNNPKYTSQYFHAQKIPLTSVKPQDNELVINIAGDMKQHELFTPETTKHLWDDIGEEYFNADTVIANLETPIDLSKKTRKDPLIMLSDVYFNAHKTFYNIFSDHGKRKYSLLLTANNHSLDQWKEGNIHTCKFLKEHHTPYIWSRLQKTQSRYHIITKKGISIAYINYTFSCNQNIPSKDYMFAINYLRLNIPDTDISTITADVKAAKKAGADMVIFCPHMGNAYQLYPSGHIVRMVHRFFDECGVDAVICTHPHNLQPMEMYPFKDPYTGKKKQWFVIYSLGDFVSYDFFTWSHMWAILQLRVKKTQVCTSITSIHHIPVYMSRSRENGNMSFRLFNLDRLMKSIQKNDLPEYLDSKSINEATCLYKLLKEHILPQSN